MTLEERASRLLAAGDVNGAATITVLQHGPAVRRFLRSTLGDPTLADDAQSLFCEWVWRGIGSFQGRSSLRTWCFGVAAHAARRVQEEPWRRRARRLSSTCTMALASDASPLEEQRQDRVAVVEELRQGLRADDRVPVERGMRPRRG